MKWHGFWVLGVALAACDPAVTASGTDDGSSSGDPSTTAPNPDPDPDPDPQTSTTLPDPSTTGVDPSTTSLTPETSSSSGEYSTSSSGEYTGSSSTGGSSSSSGESSSSTGEVIFIDPTDPPGEDCDPYLQDCPDGEKCNAWANDGGSNWNALGCFPVDPSPDQPGDSCTVEGSGVSGVDSCDVASMCWDVDAETNTGVCVAMCEGTPLNPTCADPATSCIISNGGVLNLCLPGCDPLLQNCAEGQGCYPIDDAFVCAPDASGDQGSAGDPCEFINVCDPGTACVEDDAYGPGCFGSFGCCSPFCDVDEVATCPEVGQECVPWFEEGMAPPGLASVGVCSVPV